MTANPFDDHSLRRYAWAWDHLQGRSGRHLDAGCATGPFLCPLAATTDLVCIGSDPSPEYLARLASACPTVSTVRISTRAALPFRSGAFSSATALDVLEHVPDEAALLSEFHRVLAPGGLLLVTVPARHLFSFLDPDNAKFRHPRLHRAVWSMRYGRSAYEDRFERTDDGLVGDMSAGRTEHTNYTPEQLLSLLAGAAFEVVEARGANLFWRWFQVPSLLAPGRLGAVFDRAALGDGRRFAGEPGKGLGRRANLFVAASRA